MAQQWLCLWEPNLCGFKGPFPCIQTDNKHTFKELIAFNYIKSLLNFILEEIRFAQRKQVKNTHLIEYVAPTVPSYLLKV